MLKRIKAGCHLRPQIGNKPSYSISQRLRDLHSVCTFNHQLYVPTSSRRSPTATKLSPVAIRMDTLTETEMAQITRLQRDAGVETLSRHFSWSELSDERRCFHQEFVYDVAMFAADRGFSWPHVIQAAAIARDFFPQLEDLNIPSLLSLLREVLHERVPNLAPIHRLDLTRYLTDTWIARQRLFQAAVGGAAHMSVAQLHLEVQLPPTPSPLAQGTNQQDWESQQHQARLSSALQQKEKELTSLRHGSRVTLEDIVLPKYDDLDEQEILKLVRAAVRATEGQILESLIQEAGLLSDILQLKLQQEALATGRHNDASNTNTEPLQRPATETKANIQTAKTTRGVKASGKEV